MAVLTEQIEWYVGRDVDFRNEVILHPGGEEGIGYIHEWNIEEIPKPTLEQLRVAGDEYDAYMAATQHLRDREAAMDKLLPQKMYMAATLEQVMVDRNQGKVLEPGLEEVVNIYSQIMDDFPTPPQD